MSRSLEVAGDAGLETSTLEAAAAAPVAGRAPEGVTLIVPAYNEEQGLESVLEALHLTLDAASRDYEILVVDDGSEDATARIARACDVRLIRHPVNRGYGAALKTGLRHGRHPLVAITDADGTYPIERLPAMIDRLTGDASGEGGAEIRGAAGEDLGFDMVVGSRAVGKVAIPWVRRPAKWLLGRLANFVSGRKIPDINSGLRVFRRSTAMQFFGLLPDGFSFTTTITLAMETNGYRVDYAPIEYHARLGRSKIRPIYDTLNFLLLVVRLALYFSPLKVFLPLAAFLMALGIGWGVYSFSVLGRLADTSTLVIMMAALQVGVVGFLAEIINHRMPNVYRLDE